MNQQQKEELRLLVRTFLAERSALAFAVSSVHRGVSREMKCTEPEVEEALVFLSGLYPPQATVQPMPLGATEHWKITSDGTLAHERGL